MPKLPEAPLGVHLEAAARQLARLMARAVLAPEPTLHAKRFAAEAHRVAESLLDTDGLLPAARQRLLEETTARWAALATSRLEQMRTQRQTRRRPSVLALARDALSLPAVPQSRALAEYAIVSGLRQAYGIGATLGDVEALRQSCDNLASTVAASQRRRALKSWTSTDFFALDLMVLHGHIQLAPGPDALRAELAGFSNEAAAFGVVGGRRDFGDDVWPELFGEVPAFGTLLQEAYAQPLGVPGLDEVLGGLLPVFAADGKAGGLVTLLVGPPGSGKTALCLRVARTLAQLGSSVRFFAAQEGPDTLRSKDAGFAEARWWTPLARGPSRGSGDLALMEGAPPRTLAELARRALRTFPSQRAGRSRAPTGLTPAFPRAVVVDGVGALLGTRAAQAPARAALAALRDAGVCVLLTSSPAEADAHGLGYLADNVLHLGFDPRAQGRHETRALTVVKTRLQHNDRGRHVLTVGGGDGVSLSPSLDSVLRRLERTEAPSRHGLIHLPFGGTRSTQAPRLVDPSQTLLFGWGASGKARLALSCLLAPRGRLEADALDRKERAAWAERQRTLVVSFLYPAAYYSDLGQKLAQTRHHQGLGAGALDTWAPYPGFLDAESFMDQLQRRLDRAELEGKPYTGVLLDGVHTLLLEFPLLQADELLWPCLHRILRARKLTAVSTFTFFDVSAGPSVAAAKRGGAAQLPEARAVEGRAEQSLRMLVGACDYTLNVSRGPEGAVHAEIQASMDSRARRGAVYRWDPESFTLSPP